MKSKDNFTTGVVEVTCKMWMDCITGECECYCLQGCDSVWCGRYTIAS